MSTCLRLVSLIITSSLAQNQLQAQCPITADAGPDKFVCAPNGTTILEGNIAGTYLGLNWSPSAGLSSTTVLNPTATVSGPITYTLTAQAFDPAAPNLLSNGDFEGGNSGFTSSYIFSPLPISPGSYVLTTSPALVLSTFPPCDDHTFGNGSGNMMLVNGNAAAGSQVWCQTVPVTPNTWYNMSGWAMASPISPPILQFAVNGTPIGAAFNVGTGTCDWQQFSAAWFSGTATTAQVCIRDQNGSGNGLFGDDYALDDIYFAAACTVTDQVTVDLADVDAMLPPNAVLGCDDLPTGIELDGSASSSGPNISYSWVGPGIVGGANTAVATANQPGTYTLTVTLDLGTSNCTATRNIEVLEDPNTVVAVTAPGPEITCTNPSVQLNGTGSSTGSTISYQWAPPTAVLAGQGTLDPTVNQQGTYELTVTNSVSGCTASSSVFVGSNTAPPSAAASSPGQITCNASSITLSGVGSSVGSNYEYQWAGPGILAGETTLNNCTVNAAGVYTLTVTDNANGCTATASTTVAQSGSVPTAMVSMPGSLNCLTASVVLNSTGSSTGPGISYIWTTNGGGQITSPTNGPTATVTAAGSYVLTVTNANGCTATATTNVSANLAQPVVGIAQPGMFLCNTDSLQLSASQTSSSGPGFSMAWASQNGTILSGQNTPMPWVGNAAIYTLTITDLTNGCTASASTTVSANTTPPIAQAGQNATLDCISTPVGLDGSGSSTGPSFSYQWTTTGGNIVSGGSSLMPEVNGVGTYFLTVENSANGCSAIDSVAVAQDASAPTVVIAPANQLDCDTDEITLNATGSSVGANTTITWNGPSFTDGVNTLTPTVNQSGVYQLILFNQSNNCVANASVTVAIDTLAPIADAGPAPTLDCGTPSATLDGSGSSQGPSISYLWSTNETSQTITIGSAGIYTLTVTNATNGCSASDAVTVASFGNLPAVDIAPPGSLNCTVAQLQLSATAPVGSEYFYNWTFTGTGTGIISGAGSLTPTIGSPGTYTLTVTNVQTGCSASESVLVAQNGNLPTAEAGAPQTLLCGQTSVSLNGAGSSSGAGIAYLWETQNGSILEDGTTLAPTVNAPGIYTLTVTDLQSGCSATDEVQVGQDANAPTADAGAPQTLDCSVQQVTLDGTGSSSGPGFTYLWTTSDGLISAGANTLTPMVTAAGTYLLTVTNTQNNCQTLASVQVVDLAQPPTAIATTNQQLGCGTQPIALSGMGSSTGTVYAYLWAGPGVASGGTTLSPLVNAPGIYTLTVTNLANTCTSTAQVTVIQNSTPPTAVAAAPQSITCLLQQVPLSGTGSSTGAGFSYQWQGPGIMLGGMTLMPTANAGGVYTLTVTGPNGCTATATAIVTANTTPPTAIAVAPLGLGCGTQQVQLDGTGSSTGASVFYLWQGPGLVSGQTTLTPTVNAPGTYTLTVANQANGCSATATATVNQDNPSVIAVTNAPQPLTCALTTTSIDATGSSAGANILYDWTGPGVASGDDAIQVFVTEPGTYTLTVTDQATGCTATTTAIVSADSVPPMADAGPNLLIGCSNDTLTLVGTTNVLNAEFLWTTWIVGSIIGNTAQSTILIDEPGRYVLQVINLDNGCAAFDTAYVNNDISSAIFPSINSNITDCQNPFSQVWFEGGEGGNPPFMMSMDGGNSFFTIDTILENLPSGIYNFVVIDANGCNSNRGIDFTAFPPFSVELPQILSLEFGSQGSLIPNISIPDSFIQSIVWSPGEGLSCTDCLQPMVYPLSNTFYVVTVTNKDGCSASASIMVEVSKPEGSIYVPNIFSPNGDGINDVLVVFADENQVKTIPSFQVFSRWGEAVFQGFGLQPNDATTGWDGTHRGKDVDLGVFVWYAEVELVTGERKLLKGDVAITR